MAAGAAECPASRFAIIDMVIDLPNIRSGVFREYEGSYLLGMAAGLATESNVVGSVGGMDIPLIRRFGCGLAGGVKAVNPDAEVIREMMGPTLTAFNNPERGAEIAAGQIAQGADVSIMLQVA